MIKEEILNILGKRWPPFVGGLAMGFLVALMFVWGKPWGVADGVIVWGDNFWSIFIDLGGEPNSLFFYSTALINWSFILGAFISALVGGDFKISVPSGREALRGVVGGTLMGVGAYMGFGCTVGAFLVGFGALSASAINMMIGLLIGAYIGLRIYMKSLSESESPGKVITVPRNFQFYLGIILILLIILVLFLWEKIIYVGMFEISASSLLFFGIVLGLINQRTRFCFVRAFREPFMTGDATMTKAAVLAITVAAVGGYIVKKSPALSIVAEDIQPMMVQPSFWFGSLVGGFIFGIGMVLAGGCSVGSMWRAGEGSIKSAIALFFFAVAGSLTAILFRKYDLTHILGKRVFLPETLGWEWAITLLLVLALLWYLFAVWNERTGRFTV